MTLGGYTTTFTYKYFTAPVLLRYSFAPSADQFHVDGLAGVKLLHLSSYYESSYLTPLLNTLARKNAVVLLQEEVLR